MRLNTKVAIAVAGVVLLVGATAAAAFAAASQESAALDLAGSKLSPEIRANGTPESAVASATPPYVLAEGHYGEDITLQPTVMSKIELPGDAFTFQILVNDVDASGTLLPGDPVWKNFESDINLTLEDTNTVPPVSYSLGMDDSVTLGDGSVGTPPFPYTIRVEYKPAGASTVPASDSETETVDLIKWTSTKVTMSTSGVIRHAGTTFNFTVSPDCGVGTIKVTVAKAGIKTKTVYVTTDQFGTASQVISLGSKNGTYKVTAQFLGNRYGVASKTATKNVVAAH